MMKRASTSETIMCDGISVASEGSSVAARVVSFEQYQGLRRKCVKLKMELAKLISASKENVLHNKDMRVEVLALRNENECLCQDNERLSHDNERLLRENQRLQEKLDVLTANDCTEENEVVIDDLKRLKRKISNGNTLESREVAKVLEDIREVTSNKLHQAAVDRQVMEVELQLMASQCDGWKFDAEQLAIELNEIKQQAVSNVTDLQCSEEEREHWKTIIEELAVELNETKRQNQEMVVLMGRKESDMMEMVNRTNQEMSEVISQKNEQIEKLIVCMQMHNKKFGLEKYVSEEDKLKRTVQIHGHPPKVQTIQLRYPKSSESGKGGKYQISVNADRNMDGLDSNQKKLVKWAPAG